MWGYIFSAILVGLPAAAGGFEIAKGADRRGSRAGAGLVVYAIALALAFSYYVPQGWLIKFPYAVVMPVALVVGLVVGGTVGFVSRRQSKSGR